MNKVGSWGKKCLDREKKLQYDDAEQQDLNGAPGQLGTVLGLFFGKRHFLLYGYDYYYSGPV